MYKKVLMILFFVLWTLPAFGQVPQIDSLEIDYIEGEVGVNATISAYFNILMDWDTINDTTFVVNGWLTGWHTADSFSYDSTHDMATFYPHTPFEHGEIVTIVLTTVIKDINGDTLAHSYVWSFTTEADTAPATFPPDSTYPVGDNPRSLFIADLDAEEGLDLVATSSGDNTISVLSNDGYGVFSEPSPPWRSYQVGDSPVSVFAADLNRDTWIDIVTANLGSNDVSVLFNDGNGTFPSSSVYLVDGYKPTSVFAADLNGDGYIDLATANEESHDVSVLLNNQDGTFAAAAVYSIGGDKLGLGPVGPKSIFAADLDGDSAFDLVTANSLSGDVSVLLNIGDGTFTLGSIYPVDAFGPYSVFAADLNGDGALDLTTANYGDNSVSILFNNGDGVFTLDSVYSVGGENPARVFVADVDGDGALDLMTANSYSDDISVLFNDGEGKFDSLSLYPSAGIGPNSVFAADLDGDGDLDLTTPNSGSNDVSVLLNQTIPDVDSIWPAQNELNVIPWTEIWVVFNTEMNETTIIDSPTFIVNARSTGLHKGTIDYVDGSNAAVWHHPDPSSYFDYGELVTVVLTQGIKSSDGDSLASSYLWSFTIKADEASATFPIDTAYSVYTDTTGGVGPRSVFAADLDNVNGLDLVTANSGDSTVSVLFNNGDDTFTLVRVDTVGGKNPFSVFAADIDDTNGLDLITANSGDNTASVLLNKGDGNFFPPLVYSVGGGKPISVFAADLDRDGDLDFATANCWDHTVSIFFNNGDGNFTRQPIVSICGGNPHSVSAADLDRDWDLDLITANSYSHDVSVLFNDGYGKFDSCLAWPVYGLNPVSVFAADLNGDILLDLVTANEFSHNVSILWNSADTFIVDTVSVGALNPTSVFAADLDGDLDLDLVTADSGGNSVSILLNVLNESDGDTFTLVSIYSVGDGPTSVFAADLNGDAHLDLATANSGDTSVTVLLNKYVPRIDSVSPAQNELNVALDCSIKVAFNVAMDSSTFNESTFVVNALSTGPHRGQFSWEYGSVVTFIPNEPFKEGEVVTVVLTTDIKTSEGMHLQESYAWSFTAMVYDGSGTFTPHSDYPAGGREPYSVFAAYLNADSFLDLAVANSGSDSVCVLLNVGDSSFSLHWCDTVCGDKPSCVIAADLDTLDGLDLVTANLADNTVSVLSNNGDGTFTLHWCGSVGGNDPVSVFAADLNGDGYLDLATANEESHDVSVLLNNGDGTFSLHGPYSVRCDKAGSAQTSKPRSVFAADLDSDGYIDLATANSPSGDVSVLLNKRDSTFKCYSVYSVGNGPYSVFGADLDADGDLDLATANYGGGKVSVLLNLLNEQDILDFTLRGPYPVDGGNPASVFVADLDGDGDLDLATANEFSDDVSVLFNLLKEEGTLDFSFDSVYAVGEEPVSIFAADLDGNGNLDLAVANKGSDNISVLYNIKGICGDCNADGIVNSADVVYLINYLFKGGPPPKPLWVADCNCDGVVNSADVVYLINYLFKGGPPPCCKIE